MRERILFQEKIYGQMSFFNLDMNKKSSCLAYLNRAGTHEYLVPNAVNLLLNGPSLLHSKRNRLPKLMNQRIETSAPPVKIVN